MVSLRSPERAKSSPSLSTTLDVVVRVLTMGSLELVKPTRLLTWALRASVSVSEPMVGVMVNATPVEICLLSGVSGVA